MKSFMAALSLGLVVVCCLGSSAYATLATGFYTAADKPSAAPDGLQGSTPVDVWSVSSASIFGGSASNGYGDSSTNGAAPSGDINGTGGAAWRITANGLSRISATATFAAPLEAADFVSLDFDPGGLNFASHTAVRFLDVTNRVQATLFTFGGINTFFFYDGNGLSGTGIGLSDDGFNLTLSVSPSSAPEDFQLVVKNLDTSNSTTLNGLLAGGSAIEKIQVLNVGAGADPHNSVYFNNLTLDIASTVAIPEASTLVGIPLALSIAGAAVAIRRKRNSLVS